MASRRSRIKGIANIPQRRNIVEETSVKLEQPENDVRIKEETSNTQNVCNNTTEYSNPPNKEEKFINSNTTTEDKHWNKGLTNENIDLQFPITQLATGNHNNENTKKEILSTVVSPNLELKATSNTDIANTNCSEIVVNNLSGTKLPVRRKFIKPTVNILSKKTKICTENTHEIKNAIKDNESLQNEDNSEDTLNNFTVTDTNTFNNSHLKDKHKPVITLNVNNETEVTVNEINLVPGVLPISHVLQNSITDGCQKLLSSQSLLSPQGDIEYPPPPPSPNITNRARIKAVPKLNYRKTSFSASESEDETRKTNRIRNDSICSISSVTTDIPTENTSAQKPREINTIIQKKCNRTEQTRKLAEARREFQRRFGTNAPDRQKLTMLDLIFYNPDTNPMEKAETKPKMDNVSETVENIPEDDPPAADTDKSDEENDVPVPQIKIGPSGEIILDEKSLVVERKDIKKQREAMAKSEVVNADFDTSYGIYKRHKRSKCWTTDETLRFYKALNTLGTDFTLMCELFPDRTRRELKMKFNKEEKINKTLIDRALMQPCGFDFYVLKKEVELEQIEKAELEKIKLEENRKKEEKKHQETQRKRKKPKETEGLTNLDTKLSQIPIIKKNKSKKININTILDNTEDADESDIDTNSEDEVISSHKPTRSGRMPKVPRKFDVKDEMVVQKIVKKSKDEIEPGSIMIVTENGANGEPVYKIFMITQDQERTPLELNSDEEAKAIQLKKGITAKNILTISAIHTDDEEIEEERPLPAENNMTIPADKSVTSLKSNPLVLPKENNFEDGTVVIKQDICKNENCKPVYPFFNIPREEVADVCDQIFQSQLNENVGNNSETRQIVQRRDSNFSTISYEEPLPEERNITIPADANVISLRPPRLSKPKDYSSDFSDLTSGDEKCETITIPPTPSNQETLTFSECVILNDIPKNAEEMEID